MATASNPPRPKVICVTKEEHKPAMVTQNNLIRLRELRESFWTVAIIAVRASDEIKNALLEGAGIEPGPYTFNMDTGAEVEKCGWARMKGRRPGTNTDRR